MATTTITTRNNIAAGNITITATAVVNGITLNGATSVTVQGNCPPPPVYGCMDVRANNYNPYATVSDGSCAYSTPIYGCMDPKATNYNPNATSQEGVVCTYPVEIIFGCMDPNATNYNPNATSSEGIVCTYPVVGGGGGGGGGTDLVGGTGGAQTELITPMM